MRYPQILINLACIALVLVAGGADWPQWRGPDRDGLSQEKGLLQEWPVGGPHLVWQQKDLGNGYSTPSIANGRIFLISNKGLDDEFVQALNEKDGNPVWSTHIGKVGNPKQFPNYPCARSTPTVDGNLLYALGSDGDLACLEADTGKVKWTKNVRDEFSGQPGEWAYSESPLVDGERVVVTPGGKDATMVALKKSTGDVIWKGKSPIPEGEAAGYASITIMNFAGKEQYIQFMGKGVVGVDADNGTFLWRYGHTSGVANIATPVSRDGYVYSAAGKIGGGAVKLVANGDGIKADEVYFNPKLPNAIGGVILVGDSLYGTNDKLTQCVEFETGSVKWTNEHGIAPASICYADGRLYLHGETNGDVMLVDASPQGFKERGHFTPPELPADRHGKAWEYPVIANGRLYIRDWDKLWCYDIKSGDENKAAANAPAVTTPSRN
ncbi:MAG TPA: PQQ-binding-like beta-propeller repeat protein [Lacipirellulaceae bacterium]|jgi:outer membrane protein assembly factor BamB|nr:PQQ-binding-like beta-propeller repeat protein [Lacipirellulaceae bacterium]